MYLTTLVRKMNCAKQRQFREKPETCVSSQFSNGFTNQWCFLLEEEEKNSTFSQD